MNSSGINYCHWKSNEHLSKALRGETDFDILIDEKDKGAFEKILKEHGMIQVISELEKRLPGVTDYLGFDENNGNLIHFHAHYKLILGEKKVKNYHLPLETFVLAHKTQYHNIFIPQKEVELLLLLIRIGLKTDFISIVVSLFKRKNIFPVNIERELDFLLRGFNANGFKEIIVKSGLKLNKNRFFIFINKFKSKKINCVFLFNYGLFIKKILKQYRRYNALISRARVIRSIFRNNSIIKRFGKSAKKRLAHGGKMFALVGADGSGKTTITKILRKWLAWKLEVEKYYFGIPKGQYIRILNYFIALTNFIVLRIMGIKRKYNILTAIKWIVVAKARFLQYRQAIKFIKRGGIVIADRYPLRQFFSMAVPMDGPRIGSLSKEKYKRLAEKEAAYYKKILLPDTVYVLNTSLENLRKRKGNLNLNLHRQKAEAVNKIRENEKVSVINGNNALHNVVLDIKRRMWDTLYDAY
ncbi:MAG: hypothetical protein JW822_01365 [Spirochaetales bacterium]|nr:hypothetical protein [Spirochaetales bacterium]